MRIMARTLVIFFRLKLFFVDALAFSLTNLLSPPDMATFALENLSPFLSAFFEEKFALYRILFSISGLQLVGKKEEKWDHEKSSPGYS